MDTRKESPGRAIRGIAQLLTWMYWLTVSVLAITFLTTLHWMTTTNWQEKHPKRTLDCTQLKELRAAYPVKMDRTLPFRYSGRLETAEYPGMEVMAKMLVEFGNNQHGPLTVYYRSRGESYDAPMGYMDVFIRMPYFLLYLLLLYHFRHIFGGIARANAFFRADYPRRFRLMAIGLAAFPAVLSLLYMLFKPFIARDLGFSHAGEITYVGEYNSDFVLVAILVWGLGEIFRYGYRLQADADLVV